MDLENTYTAYFFGEEPIKVEFVFGSYTHVDYNGNDNWTAMFNSIYILNTNLELKIRGYNQYGWGPYEIYHPKIIQMAGWFITFLDYVITYSNTEYASLNISLKDNPPLEFDNYFIINASVDFSTGSPNNPSKSPLNADVPGGVPDENLGGNYSYSGGIGSSICICSNGEIDVHGNFQAEVTAKSLSGKIGARLQGNLGIENEEIIWHEMDITVYGEVTIPVFYMPLSICGVGITTGIDITPHVEITFGLTPTENENDSIVPGLGIKLSTIYGNVGCRITAYVEFDIVVASLYIEASGDATLYFKTPPDDQGYFDNLVLSARIGGRLEILYWEKEGWWTYYWSYRGSKLLGSEYNETNWQPLDRSYMDPDHNSYNNYVWGPTSNGGTVIENVFPYAKPCLANMLPSSRGDEIMMVWAHDDPSKDPVEGMELRYSICHEDGSMPVIETINATRDDKLQMDPQVAFDKNGNAICVFVQLNSSIQENTSITDVMKASEIVYCILDKINDSWGNAYTITSNNAVDVSPILTSNSNGDIVLVWTSDGDNIFDTASDRSIYASFWDGIAWSEKVTLVNQQSIISGPNVAINDNGDAICVFSMKTDNVENVFYKKFRINTQEETIQLTYDYDYNDTAPSVVYGQDGDAYIIWLKNMYQVVNNQKVYNGNLFYKRVGLAKHDLPLSGPNILIANGTIYDPLAFQSQSSGSKLLENDADFLVGWRSGPSANELRYAQIKTGVPRLGPNNNSDQNLLYRSTKSLSDVYWCFTTQGVSAAVIERDSLTNNGKNCNLSFIYSNQLINLPPNSPSNPSPSNGSTEVSIIKDLSWNCTDPEDDQLSYDVYFGNSNNPPMVGTDIIVESFDPGVLNNGTTYYWKIVAHDNHSNTREGVTWSFTTVNNPPYISSDPSPENNKTNVAIDASLSWTGGDPDPGNIVTYDIYFGLVNPPPKKSSNYSNTIYNLGVLTYDSQYFWKIIAWDNHGVSTSGPLWNFKTQKDTSPQPLPPNTNTPPVADASAGEPYQNFINTEITFDGSESYDPDGTITKWFWDFGDKTNGTGKIAKHTYSKAGTYNVTLTVTDNEGAKNIDETSAVVLKANNPPTAPTISGTAVGHKGTSYNYTVVSTDPDNDTIQYIVEWGDTTTNESEFLSNGTICIIDHSWSEAGIYLVSIKAFDNYTESGRTYLIVFIDTQYCVNIGYLIDNNSDGTFDLFYCNVTGNKTTLGQENGKYLIDTNNDGKWDYNFDAVAGLTTIQNNEKKGISGFELIFVFFAISLILLLMKRRSIKT
ncbi:MAG: PKD domain-containing protein [Candidatus Thermoplasmatota archaeon]|nr:PKD domain-containing protein [Candidatus Thermoplasmatota archaeon]